MKKKKVLALGLVILVAAGVGIKVMHDQQSAVPAVSMVNTSPVVVKDLTETLSLNAPLEGTDSVDVTSGLHYEVKALYVKEGDKVQAGQLIAELDTSRVEQEIAALRDNLKLLEVQYAEGAEQTSDSVALIQAQLAQTLKERQQAYDTAVDQLEEAKRNLSQLETLEGVGGATTEEVTAARTAVAQAQRTVDGYEVENGQVVATQEEKQQLENAAADTSASLAQSIQNAKNEIARKQSDLEDCRIVSSIDGTVTRVYTKVGRFADEPTEEGRPMFTIENIDDLKMEVDVSEYDIANVALGQNVTVTADILGDGAAQGTITAISPTGEEKAGSTERVIPVEVTIEGGQEGLIAGINAKAEIAVKEAKNALVVPIEAIYDNLDGTYQVVRQNADGALEPIAVTLGVENALEIEILSDQIHEGDNIVLSPTAEQGRGTAQTQGGGMEDA